MKKKQLNEYHVDSINLHFIETDYDGRHYYYDDNKGRYVGRGGTPENPAYLYTACGRDWEPDSEVECDNINVIAETKNINKNNKVRLTESQLHQIIKESVKNVLSELDWKTYANAADKLGLQFNDTHDDRTLERARKLGNMAGIRFSQKYPKGARYRKDAARRSALSSLLQ